MKLNPFWITGFTDGEGCFSVNLVKNTTLSFNKQIQVRFSITQHQKSIKVLYALKDYFKCGVVRPNRGKADMVLSPIYEYRVSSVDHLKSKIIPFFEQYSLKTVKQQDFIHFRRVVLGLSKKEHLHSEGFAKLNKSILKYKGK